ncbi:sulfite exporter TauE/SafE family protein [Microlunatus sp. GCM10028923]|uniref:sulfite exporter TauE/SafE family protein n=1 Tax=Microlunatus sp. GCM10028923 TaxID=3273400 RepID=UPI003607F41B
MIDISIPVAVLLGLIGVAGGIGITAVGPGGVLPTIGLFALTDLSPSAIAGTAIVTHVATGLAGTAAYLRSGQLRRPATRRTAGWLAGTALLGTPVGIMINSVLSPRWFGVSLGFLVLAAALLVLIRQLRREPADPSHPPLPVVAGLGLLVGVAAGVIGIGGPMLSVPLLVAAGTEILESLAAAQVQSVIISGVGTIGYLAQGAVDWWLALIIGLPELAGVLIGWRIAHALPTKVLRYALVIMMLGIAPYLAFGH